MDCQWTLSGKSDLRFRTRCQSTPLPMKHQDSNFTKWKSLEQTDTRCQITKLLRAETDMIVRSIVNNWHQCGAKLDVETYVDESHAKSTHNLQWPLLPWLRARVRGTWAHPRLEKNKLARSQNYSSQSCSSDTMPLELRSGSTYQQCMMICAWLTQVCALKHQMPHLPGCVIWFRCSWWRSCDTCFGWRRVAVVFRLLSWASSTSWLCVVFSGDVPLVTVAVLVRVADAMCFISLLLAKYIQKSRTSIHFVHLLSDVARFVFFLHGLLEWYYAVNESDWSTEKKSHSSISKRLNSLQPTTTTIKKSVAQSSQWRLSRDSVSPTHPHVPTQTKHTPWNMTVPPRILKKRPTTRDASMTPIKSTHVIIDQGVALLNNFLTRHGERAKMLRCSHKQYHKPSSGHTGRAI